MQRMAQVVFIIYCVQNVGIMNFHLKQNKLPITIMQVLIYDFYFNSTAVSINVSRMLPW
jgi:hypothetical protein